MNALLDNSMLIWDLCDDVCSVLLVSLLCVELQIDFRLWKLLHFLHRSFFDSQFAKNLRLQKLLFCVVTIHTLTLHTNHIHITNHLSSEADSYLTGWATSNLHCDFDCTNSIIVFASFIILLCLLLDIIEQQSLQSSICRQNETSLNFVDFSFCNNFVAKIWASKGDIITRWFWCNVDEQSFCFQQYKSSTRITKYNL